MGRMGSEFTLERCAELQAEIDAGRRRDEVLAQAGMSPEEWTEAQTAWLDKMSSELTVGRFELTRRYTRAFTEHQRALTAPAAKAAVKPTLVEVENERPEAKVPVAEREIAPPPIVPPAMAVPAAPEKPSPWTHGAAAKAAESSAPTTLEGVKSPLHQPLPFRAPDPSASMNATVAGAISPFAAAPALPFAPTAAPAPSASGPASTRTPPKPPPPPNAPVAPPQAAKVPVPKSDLNSTIAAGQMSPFAAGAALPFAPKGTPAAGTSAIMAAPVQPPPANVDPGGLTLEQHASLCAELVRAPTQTAEILSRYRVTPERKAEMDRFWKARFAAEPALEKKWYEAYHLYFAFLSGAQQKT
jgi:hypothetical protein